MPREHLWVIEFRHESGGPWLFKHATTTRRSAHQFKWAYQQSHGSGWIYRVSKFQRTTR